MTPRLLNVPHIPQRDRADCLVACAAMVLAYSQVQMRYRRIATRLKTQWYGTPFSNLRYLSRADWRIQMMQGDVATLHHLVQVNGPIIIPVQTRDLPHHIETTDHAVVVIGFDDNYFYVNDPMFAVGKIAIPKGDLALAWLAHDEQCAVIVRL